MVNTLLGNEWQGDAHRTLSISKCENGYVIDATFSKWVQPDMAVKMVGHHQQVSRRYVYYTTSEALDFVRHYLDAQSEELREPNP